ncbi:hypothetical protein BC940DRAFT_293896 [Gongronella butleri]|nr:hypothetical protein BC940DRAFT_293896 [Gongronella butleri]
MSDEYIEETAHVILDLGSDLPNDVLKTLAQGQGSVAISDITQAQIYAQLGSQTFAGQMEDPIGTNMLFEMEEKQLDRSSLLPILASMQNNQQQSKWTTEYMDKADKIIITHPIEFVPKATTTSTTPSCIPSSISSKSKGPQ